MVYLDREYNRSHYTAWLRYYDQNSKIRHFFDSHKLLFLLPLDDHKFYYTVTMESIETMYRQL
jgi:hypothetical protein